MKILFLDISRKFIFIIKIIINIITYPFLLFVCFSLITKILILKTIVFKIIAKMNLY